MAHPPAAPPPARASAARADGASISAAEPTVAPSRSPCSGSRRHARMPHATVYCASPSASAADALAGSGPVRLYTYPPTTTQGSEPMQSFTFRKSAGGDTIYYVSGPRTLTLPYKVGCFFISARPFCRTW